MNDTYLTDRPGVGLSARTDDFSEGVLLDATDFYDPRSRAAVEFDWPTDFRGGGPDPSVDTTTVTVRRKAA